MRHLFFDSETLSQNVHNGVVIDFSFISVDTDRMLSDKPYTTRSIADVIKFKLSADDQIKNYGWKTSKSTLEFWSQQSIEARKMIAPKPTDITVEEFGEGVLNYLTNIGRVNYWWTRGNTFDPMILSRIFAALGKEDILNDKLKFWAVRDTRTYIDAKFDFNQKMNSFCPIKDEAFWDKVFVKHDSRWDVLADALRLQAILRAENDLEAVHR